MSHRTALALVALATAAVASAAPAAPVDDVHLLLGDDVLALVGQRVAGWLQQASGSVVVSNASACSSAPVCISIGDTELATSCGALAVEPEGFVLRGGTACRFGAGWTLVAAGVQDPLATQYAAYAALEALGFAWLHPFAGPVVPSVLVLPERVEVDEAPSFSFRSWHTHTEHPLALTSVLNGFASGVAQPFCDGGAGEELHGRSSAPAPRRREEHVAALDVELAALGEGQLTTHGQLLRRTLVVAKQLAETLDDEALEGAGRGSSAATPTYCEEWASMLPQVEAFFEWLVANRQNRFEYVLLWYAAWEPAGYGASLLRQQRVRNITDLAHAFGLAVVADVPLAVRQQHAWYMTGSNGTASEQAAQVASHVAWMAAAGFDGVSTESGFSEFTHPDCALMLQWMNDLVAATSTMPLEPMIKVHISTGQYCPDLVDPRTGLVLDFNFLPLFADPSLGAMPHTVMLYAHDDPAPVYGASNFSFMFEHLLYQANISSAAATPPFPQPSGAPALPKPPGSRLQVAHLEAAYWINYDISVPWSASGLYGERRVADYAFLEAQQRGASGSASNSFVGTNLFESGFAFGHWLDNFVAARAAWRPTSGSTPGGSGKFEELVYFVARAVAPQVADELAGLVLNATHDLKRVLIYGNFDELRAPAAVLVGVKELQVDGVRNTTAALPSVCPGGAVTQCSGVAYLAGQDTWSSFTDVLDAPPNSGTQPATLGLLDVALAPALLPAEWPPYAGGVEVLQQGMAAVARHYCDRFTAVTANASMLAQELALSSCITALRAEHVVAVYEAAYAGNALAVRQQALADALGVLRSAEALLARYASEGHYHVPVERVTGWFANPTAYHFGYLWPAQSLYFWWRQYGVAEAIVAVASNSSTLADPLLRFSPCYLNIQNPLDVAFGVPVLNELAEALRKSSGNATGWDALVDCVAAPLVEPEFPAALDGPVPERVPGRQ